MRTSRSDAPASWERIAASEPLGSGAEVAALGAAAGRSALVEPSRVARPSPSGFFQKLIARPYISLVNQSVDILSGYLQALRDRGLRHTLTMQFHRAATFVHGCKTPRSHRLLQLLQLREFR